MEEELGTVAQPAQGNVGLAWFPEAPEISDESVQSDTLRLVDGNGIGQRHRKISGGGGRLAVAVEQGKTGRLQRG